MLLGLFLALAPIAVPLAADAVVTAVGVQMVQETIGDLF